MNHNQCTDNSETTAPAHPVAETKSEEAVAAEKEVCQPSKQR